MSLKGSPYYDMALDAGASPGDEAEQMAQMILWHQHELEREHQHRLEYEAEQQALLEQEQERIEDG